MFDTSGSNDAVFLAMFTDAGLSPSDYQHVTQDHIRHGAARTRIADTREQGRIRGRIRGRIHAERALPSGCGRGAIHHAPQASPGHEGRWGIG